MDKKSNNEQNIDYEIENWGLIESRDVTYSVKTEAKSSLKWENIFVYDNNWNLVFSLDDESEIYYFFVLYENFLVLDKGADALDSSVVVYDVKSGNLVFETDYYPWETWLVINDDKVEFYKILDESLLSGLLLPECDEKKISSGYMEKYLYVVWEASIMETEDVQCMYVE